MKLLRPAVKEPGLDGTLHLVRGDTGGNSVEATTLCGVKFYYAEIQHLWQEPPHDKPWWIKRGFVEDKEITCLICTSRL